MGIGELLRSEREKRGLSLEDAENATKIRVSYLRALETENLEELPGEVYRVGFLKNYARYLGLDYQDIIAQYGDVFRKSDQDLQLEPMAKAVTNPQNVAPDYRLIRDQIAKAGSIFRDRRVQIGTAAIMVCVLLVIAVIGLARNGRFTAYQPPAQEQQEGVTTVTPPAPQMLEIKLVGREDCWAQINVDNVPSYTGTIHNGETRTFTAHQSVWMKLGNAGGVVVYKNGSELPPLGKEWDIVTREFTTDMGA